jgi:hypothetical protein
MGNFRCRTITLLCLQFSWRLHIEGKRSIGDGRLRPKVLFHLERILLQIKGLLDGNIAIR